MFRPALYRARPASEVPLNSKPNTHMSISSEQYQLQPCPACANPCSAAAAFCPKCGHPFAPRIDAPPSALNDTIFSHIMDQSSVKVGMCLTLLGLMKVVEGVRSVTTIADELLAINALAFLLSTMLTYSALKSLNERRKRMLGRTADLVFTGALILLACICAVIAFELF
jgi:hypothetical protein